MTPAPAGYFEQVPGLYEIRERLARVRFRWRTVDLGAGALALLSATLAFLLVLGFSEMFFRLTPAWRIGLLLSSLAGWAGLIWLWLVRPGREPLPDARVAIKVETAFPGLGNALINAVQLAAAQHLPAPSLAGAAIEQAAAQARDLPLEKAVETRSLRHAALACGLAVLALGLVFGFHGPAFRSALRQLFHPTSYVAAVGDHPIVKVSPGDCRMLSGGELNVEVEIAPYEGDPPEAVLFAREEGGGPELAVRMEMSERTRFLAHLKDIRRELKYRVEVSRSRSAIYTVSIIERPRVARVEVLVTPPQYTRLEPEPFTDGSGDFKAPQGSRAAVTVTVDRPVAQGALLLDGAEAVPCQVTAGVRLAGVFEVKRSGYYTVRMVDEEGHATADDAPRKIECLPDRPPAVKLVAPEEKELSVAAGASVAIKVEASDDYGLTEVSIRFKRNRDGVEQVLKTWGQFVPGRPAREAAPLALTVAQGFEPGDMVYYFGEAKDRSQTSRTEARLLKVIDPVKAREEKIEALGDVLKRLEMVLQWQTTALALTDKHYETALKAKKALPGVEVQKVLDTQTKVRAESADVARSIAPSDTALAWIRDALGELLSKPMPQAVVAAERVRLSADKPAGLAAPLNDLAAQQRLIVAGLKSILAILPKTAEALKDDVDPTLGHDLPNDVKKELEDLKEKAKDFAAEQKKVIQGSEDLAKKPVEDLTGDQKNDLEKLKVIEDKWEKFLKEAYSDLSKIPPQDFSDPRLLQELVQTYEEVELAKDSLSKKATEIAVSLEESGLENAKEMTTHIEKWLPDKPDREKWTMEEPIGEGQTPMAELPKELEDIVGDLLEQEEDLMDEADDATSKWADSLDKGAGWDAADGPISNMSAQGVTGNTLPNTSEIAGRSGEGRTGKSAGELVSDSTVGKGGRKTPTRLTPDPFEAGQVKDTSKDPAGGATGGGKQGGAGGEGLEGPVPPDRKLLNERLSGQQADLRNKAERIALNLKMMNYPSADLEKAIREMKAIETTLKDGRYSNIARQRQVILKDLKGAQGFAGGVARIARDGAPNLPRKIQDEVLDALSGENTPKGYEDLLKGYYDSLMRSNPGPAPAKP